MDCTDAIAEAFRVVDQSRLMTAALANGAMAALVFVLGLIVGWLVRGRR